MKRKMIGASLAIVPLVAIGGYVGASSQTPPATKQAQVAEQGYICPVTGEELPCPKCCVLNESKAQ
jgi:hypothetical protein